MRKFLIFLSALLIVVLGLWATVVIVLDEARLKAIAVEQVRERTGRTLILDGPLQLDLFPRIQLVARDVRLSGPAGYDGPDLFTADAFRMTIAVWPLLRGDVETGAIELAGADIRLHTDAGGRSTLDGLVQAARAPADSTAETDSSGAEIEVEAVRLDDVRLVVSESGSPDAQEFLLRRFEIESFRFDADVPFVFRGQVGDPPVLRDLELTGTLRVPRAAGSIQLKNLEFEAYSGELQLALEGSLEVRTGDPVLARLVDGQVVIGEDSLRVTAEWRGTPRPSVSATVRGEQLDVDALLALVPEAESPEVDDDSVSPLLIFRRLDADADLQLDAMRIGGLALTQVEARLTASDGVVRLDPLQAILEGGRVDASAELDVNAEPPVLDLRPRFELESLSDALAPWGLGGFLSGSGSLALQLTGRGVTPDAVLASLDGTGRYDLRDGAIEGLDLDAMVDALVARDIAAAVGQGLGGRTRFREFAGPLSIDDGVVDLSGLSLLTERLGVGGTLALDLDGLALDGQLRLAGERLERVPVRLSGTLTSPEITPDLGEALRDEASRRVIDWLRSRNDGEDPDPDDG
ncbi:AsmA family protein [Wenzhouxiangella sp. XN79A]|uniref:AsmA family protein n=1 Tax=Wenzhouxiangella sp. XN79A TaxID=2724193 RepID=UPI00144AC7EC|nr:AsmA family protein [Wenzhouxiangella sp. XN79A]NKI33777.1 AsmA family protein [Wenzhouxiangella sp. XN79A]